MNVQALSVLMTSFLAPATIPQRGSDPFCVLLTGVRLPLLSLPLWSLLHMAVGGIPLDFESGHAAQLRETLRGPDQGAGPN